MPGYISRGIPSAETHSWICPASLSPLSLSHLEFSLFFVSSRNAICRIRYRLLPSNVAQSNIFFQLGQTKREIITRFFLPRSSHSHDFPFSAFIILSHTFVFSYFLSFAVCTFKGSINYYFQHVGIMKIYSRNVRWMEESWFK